MIIHSMRASFGKLEDRELKLQPGLNLISGANETGKTTWMAFLLAMLYGLDTRDRGKGGRLPDKLKYQPWSGKPMGGTMELSAGDQRLTLERSSQTGPMQDFRAWDTETGTVQETLSGKSCGQALLGVEAAVYARSGYLRQQRISVSADAQLEKRLSSLVTTGTEDYAYAELDEQLKKLQNSLRSSQGGALPRAEAARTELERRLAEIARSRRRLTELETEIRDLKQRRAQCRETLAGLDALERRAQMDRAEDAEAALREAVEDREAWQEVCGDLPPAEQLQELEARLQLLQADLERTALDEGLSVEELELPEPDPVFGRMGPKEAHDKAARDIRLVQQAKNAKRPRRKKYADLWLLPVLLGLGLGFFGALRPMLAAVIGGVVPALAGLVRWLWLRIRFNREKDAYLALQQQARSLLEQYGAVSGKEMLDRSMAYIRDWTRQEDSSSLHNRAELMELAQRRSEIYRRIEALMPGCGSPEKAAALFQEAAKARGELERAILVEEQRSRELEALRASLAEQPEPEADLNRFAGLDRDEEQARLEEAELSLEATVSRADKLSGAIDQMGDPLALEAEKEALTRKIQRMEHRLSAVRLARKALAAADESLRARFSPLLCEQTGQLFARLTQGKYDRIQLDRAMHITVHPAGSPVYRPLSCLSGGTVDQLYLALRLAICQLLIPEAPIVLDDALAYFDDLRAEQALRLLRELGKTRQILLFTCHSREKQILNRLCREERTQASAAPKLE